MKTFVNTSRRAIQRGAVRIPAGQCRGVADRDLLPTDRVDTIHAYPQDAQAPAPDTAPVAVDLAGLLLGNVDSITGALAHLSDEQLAAIEALEEGGKKRKTVLSAIVQLKVQRADAGTSLDSLVEHIATQSTEQLVELAELHANDDTVSAAIEAELQARADA